jgi:hypothetical protein
LSNGRCGDRNRDEVGSNHLPFSQQLVPDWPYRIAVHAARLKKPNAGLLHAKSVPAESARYDKKNKKSKKSGKSLQDRGLLLLMMFQE